MGTEGICFTATAMVDTYQMGIILFRGTERKSVSIPPSCIFQVEIFNKQLEKHQVSLLLEREILTIRDKSKSPSINKNVNTKVIVYIIVWNLVEKNHLNGATVLTSIVHFIS